MRRALTLIEMIVVLAIIVALGAMVLAAVLQSREAARRLTCGNNLRQVNLGMQNYVSTFSRFPSGGGGSGYSFLVRLLPFVGEQSRYDSIDFGRSYEEQFNEPWIRPPTVYLCPSDPVTSSRLNRYACNYVGVAGGGMETEKSASGMGWKKNGVLPTLANVRAAEITDGLSNTLVLTESASYFQYQDTVGPSDRGVTFKTSRRFDFPDEIESYIDACLGGEPMSKEGFSLGYYWPDTSIGITRMHLIFPVQKRNCSNFTNLTQALLAPSGLHGLAVYCGVADGSVRIVFQDIDPSVWQALGTRNGGEVVQLP